MPHEDFLDQTPVFTGRDLAAYCGARDSSSTRRADRLLAGWQQDGRVVRVHRNLYAAIPRDTDPALFQVDPYLVAWKLTPDAVVSHHSALEFHGRAHTLWRHLLYSATRPVLPFVYGPDLYRGVRFPAALRRAGAEHFGVEEVAYRGGRVRLTSLERTLVDVLASPDLGGGWEEIWRSLQYEDHADVSRVVDYTLLLGNSTTCAKVGFFLDQHRDHWTFSDSDLEPLRRRIPRQPHDLERRNRRGGRLVKDWNLIVPMNVLEQTWDELAWLSQQAI